MTSSTPTNSTHPNDPISTTPSSPGAKRRPVLFTHYRWVLVGAVIAFAVLFPWLVDRPRFWIPNIGIRTLWLGTIAMSLVFLNKYVGLLSLAQVTFAGIAAYGVGYFSVTLGLPYIVAVPIGIAIGTFAGFVVALIAVRTKAIYFLMITLAIGQVFFSYASQAIEVTGARRGLSPILREDTGFVDFRNLEVFYYTALVAVVALYLICHYLASTSFGFALQGIRDSPDRMAALGYRVNRYRVAAVTFAAFVASVGGMILVFERSQVDPDVVSLGSTLDVLIAAVIGGVGSLGGVFLGAVVLALIDNFAQDFTERYQTLTGVIFIVVLLFAPAGLAGVGGQVKRAIRKRRDRAAPPTPVHQEPQAPVPAESAIQKGNQQ